MSRFRSAKAARFAGEVRRFVAAPALLDTVYNSAL